MPGTLFHSAATAGAMKLELLPLKCALEAGEELASKDPTQHSHRQKKARRQGLQRIVEVGQAQATSAGLNSGRTDYLLAAADTLRIVRSREVRDIRHVTIQNRDMLKAETGSARMALERAKTICSDMLASIKTEVGREALADLRRKWLAAKPD
jgi:hypothetical protein